MARLSEEELEELRRPTVMLILEIRGLYLRTPGANVLKHWDQLTARIRSAARTSASVGEWLTSMLQSLQIPSPSNSLSKCLDQLDEIVGRKKCSREWLDMIEREYGLLMAHARLEAELRRDAEWRPI